MTSSNFPDPCTKAPAQGYELIRLPPRYRIFVDIANAFILKNIALHLCGLTLDRYLVMFRPFKYVSMVNKRSVLCYVSLVWIFSFSVAGLQCSWLRKIIAGPPVDTVAFCEVRRGKSLPYY